MSESTSPITFNAPVVFEQTETLDFLQLFAILASLLAYGSKRGCFPKRAPDCPVKPGIFLPTFCRVDSL